MAGSNFTRLSVLAMATALALSACGNKNEERQAEIAQKMAAAEPEVRVLTVQPENVLLETELTGRLESVRTAVITPQVSGIVKRRLFEEGSFVRAGQPLYELDDASYRANLESARASLLSAQATLAKANADVARYRPLVEADAISQQEWDAALTAKRSAEAAIASANAAIKAAQVNVGYARITAPISGFIGQSAVTEGALVTANSTQMATIQQTDPMYVNITQSASDFMKLNNQLASGERALNREMEASLQFEDGTEYRHKGRLLFTDPTVNKETGQITLRAGFPNPEGILLSGLFVKISLPISGVLNAFVVPQQAVSRGQSDTVTVVTADGQLQQRTVKIAGQKGTNWVINEGLNAGDKVVMDGTMIAGMLQAKKVKAVEWQPDEAAAAASAPAAASDAAASAENAGNRVASESAAASAAQ